MHVAATQTTLPDDLRTPASSRSGEPGAARLGAAIFWLALAMHLPWLGISPIAGTEGHRIFPAHAMVQTGWWSVPMLFGRPLLSKPPLHHWLIALSETITRRGNVFVWRLPSAINGAAVCAVACWFAVRWFGRVAGWISGFCAVGLITIWGQAHVADIDATNTLAAALTALCGIELFVARREMVVQASSLPRAEQPGSPHRNQAAAWVMTTGLALAATIMTKGPGGLPIILGVWVYALIAVGRGQRLGLFASARFWLPWVIAIALFGLWVLAAWHALHVRGLPIDWKGVNEGSRKVHAGSLKALAQSLAVLPPQLVLFALPVSLALPLYFHPEVRARLTGSRGTIAKALVGSVLLSWAVCVLTAMTNPRYAYPTLIPLCPLAGAVAVAAGSGVRSRALLGAAASISAILFVAGSAALTKMGWPTAWGKPLLGVTLIAILAVAGWTIWQLRSSWRGAWGLALLAVLAIIPFSVHEQLARIATSGVGVAPILERVVGENGVVAVGGAVTSKPEAFYYARVQLHFYKPDFTPQAVPPGSWVVLDQAERKRWLAVPGVRLEQDRFLCKWGPTNYFIAWYAAR